jgi:hypothetical protein
MTRAPDLATLYDFESHFLRAASSILEAAGFNVFTQLDPLEELVTPRLEVFFVMQPEDDAMSLTESKGEPYYNSQHGRLDLNVVTRAVDGANLGHGTLRGRVRVEMLRMRRRWVEPTLPYYHLWRLQGEASKPETQGQNDEIISRLSYSLSFRIPPESMPADA